MSRFEFRSTAAAAVVLLALAGCASPNPGSTTTPSADASAPWAPTASTKPTASTDPNADWQSVEIDGGALAWRMPADWTLNVEQESGGDYIGQVLDGDGVRWLQYKAILSGEPGSEIDDCEVQPSSEVLSAQDAPSVGTAGAQLVAVASYDSINNQYALYAGLSEVDPESICEPDLVAVYPENGDYRYISMQLIEDGSNHPMAFESARLARSWLDGEDYQILREIMLTFTYTPKS